MKATVKSTGEWGTIVLEEGDDVHLAMFGDKNEVRLFSKEELTIERQSL